jgi:hypothetical protein
MIKRYIQWHDGSITVVRTGSHEEIYKQIKNNELIYSIDWSELQEAHAYSFEDGSAEHLLFLLRNEEII